MNIEPPCPGCGDHARPPDEIMPENIAALEIFRLCADQWLVSFSGAYALDGDFVMQMIDRHGIKDDLTVYRRVQILAGEYLKEKRKQRAG